MMPAMNMAEMVIPEGYLIAFEASAWSRIAVKTLKATVDRRCRGERR